MDRTTLLAKRSALEPLPGQEAPLAQRGRRPQELSGRAGAPCSAQEASTGWRRALCFPEDVVFSKTLRHFGLSF